MLIDLIKQNRSYRAFDESVRIDRQTLLDLVDAARFAPSSVNMQPFKYMLICDERNDIVFPLTAWARMLPDFAGPPEGKRPTGYIIICTDKTIAPNTERFLTDVGIVAQTIMLAAVEKGFGGCMIGNYSKEKVSEVLALPDHLYPSLILALGKPAADEIIELTEAEPGQDIRYYRKDGVHYVPKRQLKDIVF